MGVGNDDLVVRIYRSELDALTENEKFEPGAMGPPDNIISIAGSWNRRMFCLTEEGWLYPSTQKSPSSYSLYQAIDLRMYGTPYWVAKTVSGIFVGCSKDIIRIAGSGENNDDGVTCDLYAQPLNLSNPPVDRSVCVDLNIIGYRAADGPMMFSGASSSPIPFAGTSLLWRGIDRYGIGALDIENGRFRMAVDNHFIYMLAPEGSVNPTSIWRYADDQWWRFTYKHNIISLHRETSGRMLAGTDDGVVLEIEKGVGDDNQPCAINILTKYVDCGVNTARKDPADLQIHTTTGGVQGVINLYMDRITKAAKSIPFSSTVVGSYRAQIQDIGPFLRIQYEILGSFYEMSMHAIGVSFTQRPNNTMSAFLGAIIPPDSSDLAWVNQVELDCYSPENLYLDVYKNGVLHSTELVQVTPNVRDIYTVILPRDTKARRLTMWLRTVSVAAEGQAGFEL
jgi:hypothetical protein